jgi:hypothetical protein
VYPNEKLHAGSYGEPEGAQNQRATESVNWGAREWAKSQIEDQGEKRSALSGIGGRSRLVAGGGSGLGGITFAMMAHDDGFGDEPGEDGAG